jgi:hypothetical protein
MSKNIQIPISVFFDMLDFVNDPNQNYLLRENLQNALNQKLDALIRHLLFSKYKSAPVDSFEREQFRRQYLDKAYVMPLFRSENETPWL